MEKKILEELAAAGQSIWLDFISRRLIESGRLAALIRQGLRGMTSNPTIFDQAISQTSDYDEEIRRLKTLNKSAFEIYDELSVEDIQDAADMFFPVYERTGGLDGYVSLEIDPRLAHDTHATIREGIRVHAKVNRLNCMVKVPCTDAGFPAIEELVAAGISVNATLIFSLPQYERAARAYRTGLGRLKHPAAVRSVASVFVSRFDTSIDASLKERGGCETLLGKAAVANARLIYSRAREIFGEESFLRLERDGAHRQRVLWASTGTKNPQYSDIKYITELIAPDTVNTVPEKTLEAFLDHGSVREAMAGTVAQAQAVLRGLADAGIDTASVFDTLLADGVSSFQKAFGNLLGTIEKKAVEEKSRV